MPGVRVGAAIYSLEHLLTGLRKRERAFAKVGTDASKFVGICTYVRVEVELLIASHVCVHVCDCLYMCMYVKSDICMCMRVHIKKV